MINVNQRLITALQHFVLLIVVVTSIAGCSEQNQAAENTAYQWQLPSGFPKPQIPTDNPMTEAKVALGKALFYDKNLSFNQQQSCESCHLQQYAFAEPLVVSVGSTGEQHRRNAPALVNIAYNKTLTWAHDGLSSLERQILLPIFGEQPIELGVAGNEAQVLARFDTPVYRQLFAAAFGDSNISFDYIVKALSSFVRSLISLNAPFDAYAYQADDNAISASAIRGMDLFFSERLECHHCHGGFNFTQSTSHEKQPLDRRPFHNTGLYNVSYHNNNPSNNNGIASGYPLHDVGLSEITTFAQDNGRFRAPTLRNIAVTAPYMHDGSIATLAEVIDFYAAGGRNITEGAHVGDGRLNPLKSPFIKGFELTEQERLDLLSFLDTLTDVNFLQDKQHMKP